ncbi:MAG: alpha/beta hydrolase [Bauldia sp.]|uniref:alpha/beta fold hydrolase n=1 Tax=Bauldia sp. TaxID=2575872 RepID=UPI001DEC3B07|nr:alpha/beta hydrolase [Bauldia sp.]MCB1498100.1 alpha/beta hydrolase [Bauldia sp.]
MPSPSPRNGSDPTADPAGTTGAARTMTLSLETPGGTIAYRRLGPAVGRPLVLLNRFRGTMDDWDPAFLDRVAAHREVVVFDNLGVARSGGAAPATLRGWAKNVATFIHGLGYDLVDVLGFSFGGLVAQELTLAEPNLVRRLLIVGSGAGHVDGWNVNPEAISVATKPVNSDEDFLVLFFRDTPASQAAGRAYLARLRERPDAFAALVNEPAWKAMLAASSNVGTPETSLLKRSGAIRQPVLIANGIEDIMIPTYQSYALAQVVPNARLVLYPDSGHGFLFQYPEHFGDEVVRFLEDEDSPT